MAKEVIIDASLREETGKNANRRLRVEGKMPAILYGVTNENINLSVVPREIEIILKSKKGANTLFHINMIGERTTRSSVMIKDYQLDPVRDELIHCDFIRVKMEEPIHTTVPINIIGRAKGVVDEGGVLEIVVRSLDVKCLPVDIPESIDIEISDMNINDTIRVKDIAIGDNVLIVNEENLLVLHVVPPRKVVVEKVEEEGAEAVEGEESSEDEDKSGE
jgi:large subunit ribosomal protein L25